MAEGKILAIFVGKPRTYPIARSKDRVWTTSIFKELVSGPVWLSDRNLAGDQQADLSVHGSPDQAVNIYSADHYPYWQNELNNPNFGYGAFGENFVVEGLTENTVCIGDTYEVGEAMVQVSQPRGPCWKIAERWGIKTLTAKVARSGFTGWYVRVLQAGYVEAGNIMRLLKRPYPEYTITEANQN